MNEARVVAVHARSGSLHSLLNCRGTALAVPGRASRNEQVARHQIGSRESLEQARLIRTCPRLSTFDAVVLESGKDRRPLPSTLLSMPIGSRGRPHAARPTDHTLPRSVLSDVHPWRGEAFCPHIFPRRPGHGVSCEQHFVDEITLDPLGNEVGG